MDSLHATFLPILRRALTSLELPCTGTALDCASGTGHKLPLLHELLDQHMPLVALDRDQHALDLNRATYSYSSVKHVVADAHSLPLSSASIDIAFCLAALGLFHDQHLALTELRRILKPQACLLVSLTEMRWCEHIPWPTEIMQAICAAYPCSPNHWHQGIPVPADISDDFHALLVHAGFSTTHMRAFLLEPHLPPEHAELALLPWQLLRPRVAPRLSQSELRDCDKYAATPELELCPIVLIAKAIP